MKNRVSWQLETENAKFYEEYAIPAVYAQWAPRSVRAAGVIPGDRVLDIATGTGLVARFAAQQAQPDGTVVGYDLNPGMLSVAASIAPQLEWMLGPAEKLPFETQTFDAVICQFGLVYVQDKVAALREMYRVLRLGRTLSIAVWDRLDNIPGYLALANLVAEICGAKATEVLRAPFNLGDKADLLALFEQANLPEPDIHTLHGNAKYPSIEAWIECEVLGSAIKNLITDEQLVELKIKATETLLPYTTADGRVLFGTVVHMLTLVKK